MRAQVVHGVLVLALIALSQAATPLNDKVATETQAAKANETPKADQASAPKPADAAQATQAVQTNAVPDASQQPPNNNGPFPNTFRPPFQTGMAQV